MNIIKIIVVISIVCLFLGNSIVIGLDRQLCFTEVIDKINCSGISHSDLNDGLVGYWDFEEGSGLVAEDESGNNNHGQIINATHTKQCKKGEYALNFDGIDDIVRIKDSKSIDSLNETGEFSFVTWIYPRGTEEMGIMGFSQASIKFAINTSSFLTLILYPPWRDVIWHFDNLETDKWHMVAATHNREKGDTILYYNNGLEVASEEIFNTDLDSDQDFCIGNYGIWEEEYFYGIIDDVRVYNRTLTSDEIKELYGGPKCSIVKPREPFLYINDNEIGSFLTTVIIGPRDGITVQIEPEDIDDISEIRVYINDKDYSIALWNDRTQYFEYLWDEQRIGACTLKAKAIDYNGAYDFSEEINLIYINI